MWTGWESSPAPAARGACRPRRGCGFDVDAAHPTRVVQAGLSLRSSWVAHELEAWVARASVADPSLVYTGADDSAFKWQVALVLLERVHCS